MPTKASAEPRALYSWAVLRVVPRPERGERLNVGVVLYCRDRDFVRVRTELDEARLRALFPELDLAGVRAQLEFVQRIADGAPEAGPLGKLTVQERFGWLTSPSSTVVQPSRVHTGLCESPEAALDQLFAKMVAKP